MEFSDLQHVSKKIDIHFFLEKAYYEYGNFLFLFFIIISLYMLTAADVTPVSGCKTL